MTIKFKFSLQLCFLAIFILLNNCGLFKKVDTRKIPQNAQERARQNVEQGRGVSVGGIFNRGGGTNYEFSSSNPLWRASLEILDFLPLTTVDYSGGVLITDWYYDSVSKSDTALKITVRFLSNEIKSNSFKVIVHQRVCVDSNKCTMKKIDSRIKEELVKSILSKAVTIKAAQKQKK